MASRWGSPAVWSTWRDPETEELIRTCAIVTTAADGPIAAIHNRMPVALDPAVWDIWLDRDITDTGEIEALIQPIPADLIMEHEVSPAVNSVRNNERNLTDPAGPLRLV